MVNAATATNFQDKIEAAFEEKFSQEAQAKDAIAALSLALSGIPESEFLTEYALAVSKVLDADHFAVARLNPYSNLVRTLRFVAHGELGENVIYSLDGTPCARAVDGKCCIITENVAQLFPRDQFLVEKNISSYAGVALTGKDGTPIGVVVAMTKHKQQRDIVVRQVLEFFKARIEDHIEQAEKFERIDWAITQSTNGIWDWDVVTGTTVISDGIETLLGFSKDKGPYDLAAIEKTIHKDDLERFKMALRAHLCAKDPFDLKIRMKHADGSYHWVLSRGEAIRDQDDKPIRMVGCFSDIHNHIDA
ncbi:PAS domain-containing protein [Hyphococcus formosus]|uniref:PAS domain-containing protein n=1 Tax=Hyphococcus formosus TaxID=3143534 RepID=UPI00398A96B0